MDEYIETTPDYASQWRLDGRHVLVLGAGQGIGRQTCLGAAALGAKVTCVDSDVARAERVAAETGGLALGGDVTSRGDLERIIARAVDAHGPLAGLVDIVGIAQWGTIREMDDETWQRGLDLNLRHAFLAMQLGTRAMTGGGAMVFVASISGLRSSPNHAAYGAAKAGLVNLVATAALELGPTIRVNAVAPGQTVTPRMVERHRGEPAFYEERAKLVPLRRIGQPGDIASALLFLLGDGASWITGQTIVVDGGAGKKFQYDV